MKMKGLEEKPFALTTTANGDGVGLSFFFFFLVAAPCSLRILVLRDQTCAPCTGAQS